MKLFCGLFGLVGAAVGGLLQVAAPTERWSIVVSGDTLGYLSPCGCTDPMTGGIRRRASAVRELKDHVLFVDNGSLVKEPGRQSEMKAETLAEALHSVGVDAINLTSVDAQLGKGAVLSISRLSGNRLISIQADPESELKLPRWIAEGPFLISGGTTRPQAVTASLGVKTQPLEEAVPEFVVEALSQSKTPVLLLEGSLEDAQKLAKEFPLLGMVVYRSVGDPPASEVREGSTILISPGDRGRSLVRMSYGNEFAGYRSESLGPEHKDDAHVSRVYATYLKRVNASDLLERVPRSKGDPFAGNKKCVSCHGKAGDVWKKSGHSHALATLEKEGHARDPDCVSCHVVGLTVDTGFRSRKETPHLTDVGCESCHGAGAAHSSKPYLEKMAKVGPASCVPCHTPENSPRFDFTSYWAKIKH